MATRLSKRSVVVLVAIVIGSTVAYRTISAWYLQPRHLVLKRIETAQSTLSEHARSNRESAALERTTAEVVNRTLGSNLEAVDHRLRTRLNRLAEQSRIQGVSVGTEGGGRPRLSPARSSVFRSYRALRDELDFVEVEGWISGVGTLEDVVRLMTAIAVEPWIKRIDRVQLDPRDNGERLNVSLRLTTIFLPGREPLAESGSASGTNGNGLASRRPEADELLSKYAALVNSNPFRVPPPPQAVASRDRQRPAPPVPAPPPAFPFGEWLLTGVAQGAPTAVDGNGTRWEAWLRHHPSGETRVLALGETLDAMTFVEVQDDHAQFDLAGQRFAVAIGTTMDKRIPVSVVP